MTLNRQKTDMIEDRVTKQKLSDTLSGISSSLADITSKQGDLTQLNTTDKSSVVNALKEIKTQANSNAVSINNNATAIANIGNGSPKGTYATLSALQTAFPTGTTGVYVVTADGGWYYWSGSAWTKGGTYQSSGIADGSVSLSKLDANVKSGFMKVPMTLLTSANADGTQSSMNYGYPTIMDYVIPSGTYIKEIKTYANVAGSAEIYILHKNADGTYTIDSKTTFTAVVGYNTVSINYTLTQDSYLAFNGGTSYKTGITNGWYTNAYQPNANTTCNVNTVLTITKTLSNYTFNIEVHTGTLIDNTTTNDLYTQVGNVNNKFPSSYFSSNTLSNLSVMAVNYHTIIDKVIPSGTHIKDVKVYANSPDAADIYILHKNADGSFTIDFKASFTATNGYNTVFIDYVLTQDSYIGFNGGTTFSRVANSSYGDYYQLNSTNRFNVNDVLTGLTQTTTAITFNLEVFYGDLATFKEVVTVNNRINAMNPVSGKKYACFGDSITSDQVTGIGTAVNSQIGTTLVGNYACGYASCSDWHDPTTGANTTTITLTVPNNTDTNDNVLSNQVRRLLQHTTASGAQITWTHPTDGTFSLDTSVGTGLGYTSDIPDIIYIAISTNDGKNTSVPINDDSDTVIGQTYSQLTRLSIASALRWAIETLQSAYPNAQIFVASPLQADTSNTWMSFANNKLKRDIIQKICQFCSVYFIDSFNESGFSKLIAHSNGGIHPTATWKNNITKFVAERIQEKYVGR